VTASDPNRRPLTVNGQHYWPTMDDVLAAMKGAPTRPIAAGNWWGEVRGRKHPLKVITGATLGLKRSEFSRDHAIAFARYVGLPFGQEPGEYVR
jgi:hypothetical protein